jgi:hypothetical protein
MQGAENDVIRYEIKDGILIGVYKVKVLDYSAAVSAVQLRKEFTGDKAFPNLAIGLDVMSIEKGARDYFTTKEATEGVLAGGLMSNSFFQVTLLNFFLRVGNPKIPAKLFTNENEAIEWLSKYKI